VDTRGVPGADATPAAAIAALTRGGLAGTGALMAGSFTV
jgi:hypothetical protein